MSDLLFPVLPGLKYPVGRAPIFETRAEQMVSGRRYHSTYLSYPQIEFTLNFEFMRASAVHQEYQALAGLFLKCHGGWDTFLFVDPFESLISNVQFGVGDGVTRQFALTRPLGGFSEPVGWAAPTSITVNGSAASHTILEDRVVDFAVAPAANAALVWSGNYAYRCYFAEDKLAVEEFMHRFFQTSQLKLRTWKR